MAEATTATVPRRVAVLARPNVHDRPRPDVWSPLEYACHVRDVYRVFGERLTLMLEQDSPTFDSWDQDATAVADRYGEQEPAAVTAQLVSAGTAMATRFAEVAGTEWERAGVRSNGSRFTVLTLGQYFLHDVVHHLHDVDG
ncbi:MAG TPA: DinB family protein [Actinotalea sp.]|nr:DinB family protein [Actinotalea sp.]